MDQQAYRELISGRRKGAAAKAARLMLRVLSWGYGAGVAIRNLLYDVGLFKSSRVEAPVISVGNLTVGGTGKTPLVIWLCKQASERNVPHAILTRGYKTKRGQLSDEPQLLAASCPDTPVVVNPDRVAGAGDAIRRLGAKLLVLDDGFQHRRLARRINIVAIDVTCPFGFGKLLPAGLLREPIGQLRRADAVVLTRCDQASDRELDVLEARLRSVKNDLVIARSVHAPLRLRKRDGGEIDLELLKGRKVVAFCAIGNPEAFVETLARLGAEVVVRRVFDDHHAYQHGDVASVCESTKEAGAELIVTTAKDWTKLGALEDLFGDLTVACLEIEMRFQTGELELLDLMAKAWGTGPRIQ